MNIAVGEARESLSVLMPFYNERETLTELVRRVLTAEPGVPVELVMVDDCSTDGSGEIAAELGASDSRVRLLRHERNRGKGAAVRTAVAAASGTISIIQDADFEYDPREYRRLVSPILAGEADAVYGSRFAAGAPAGMSRLAFFANRFLTRQFNLLYGTHLTDMETCYKAVRTDLLRSLRLTTNRFGIEPEITAGLVRAKARILEVPISYHPRSYVEGKKVSWRDGAAAVWHILRLRLRR